MRARSRRRDAGFGLVELLLATSMIATVLLAHAMSIAFSHTASVNSEERGVELLTTQRFVERLRADTGFAGLYARLRARTSESAGDMGLTSLGRDDALAGFDATAYYADFTVPPGLGTWSILVQVPVSTVGGVSALRENLVAPRYGLPADLNGDGVIDADPRDSDYVVLPVVVRVRCRRRGHEPREVVLATWLRSHV